MFLPALPHPRGKQNAQTLARPRAIPKPELRSHAASLGRIGSRFENNSKANSRKIVREKSSLHPVDHVRKSNAKNSRDIRVPTQQS